MIFASAFLINLQFLHSFSFASGQTRQACWPRFFVNTGSETSELGRGTISHARLVILFIYYLSLLSARTTRARNAQFCLRRELPYTGVVQFCLRRELPYTKVVQLCLRRELPYTGVVQLCLRRKLPVPGTKRGAILYLCGEY